MALQDLHILNTRPKTQAGVLNTLLEKQGANVINLPTIEIIPANDLSQLSHLISQLSLFEIIIFVSANAVDYAIPYWPKNVCSKIIAIGNGTAAALKRHGLKVDYQPTEMNSEGLIQLEILQKIQGTKIMIMSGANTRPFLANTLIKRGAHVEICACYQRYCPFFDCSTELSKIQSSNIDCIISTSLESLHNLYSMLGAPGRDWLLKQRLLVISSEMKNKSLELGFINPLLAENATNEAIVNCLLIHYNTVKSCR